MSIAQLPLQVDPRRFAEQGIEIEGQVAIAELERLADKLLDKTGMVWAKIGFDRDAGGCDMIKAQVKAALTLQCQRCMQPMTFTVDSHFILSPVANEQQAENLPADYEALPLPLGDLVSLQTLIEDEILLSLPIVPKHEPASCKIKLADANRATRADEALENKINPFAVLQQLKKK